MTCSSPLLLMLDSLIAGPLPFMQSHAKAGLVPPMLDPVHLGVSPSARSLAQMGVAMVVLDLVVLDVSLLSQGSLQGNLA
eukprot:6481015-Amphidinium_carterae.1